MLEIGTHRLRNNVFLAPMAGITDLPFRALCARYGAGYAASEMIASDTLLYASAKTRHRLKRARNNLPHAIQIAGADPGAMADAAAYNVAAGAEIIDINMGCPAKKVCNRLAGSALLEHPQLVQAILRAVIKRVSVPVTLKIRTGPTPANRNGVQIARIAEREGVCCLAVHGRTRAERFHGEAEYDTIAAIKQAVAIPVIANGDIRSGADAESVLRVTGADGVMIGRAAQGDPFVFARIVARLAGRTEPPPPDAVVRHIALVEHVRGLHALYGEYRGVRIARKHIAWYCKGDPDAAAFRRRINTRETTGEQLSLIDAYFSAVQSRRVAA